jgi:hypothetical protein
MFTFLLERYFISELARDRIGVRTSASIRALAKSIRSIQSKFYTIGLLTSLNFRAGSPSNVTAQATKSRSQTSVSHPFSSLLSRAWRSPCPDREALTPWQETSHPMHNLSRSHSHSHAQDPTDKSAHDGASVDVHEDEYASTTGLRRM